MAKDGNGIWRIVLGTLWKIWSRNRNKFIWN